jgi:hypothetical protein
MPAGKFSNEGISFLQQLQARFKENWEDRVDCKVIGRVGTSTITNKKRKHPVTET